MFKNILEDMKVKDVGGHTENRIITA